MLAQWKRTIGAACLGLAGVVCLGGCPSARSPAISPEARARAESVWRERCISCHGAFGRGDGLGSRFLGVAPRDFGHPGWQATVTDDRIARAIVDGGAVVGLSPLMPGNADLQSEPEVVAALVEAIRAMGREPAPR